MIYFKKSQKEKSQKIEKKTSEKEVREKKTSSIPPQKDNTGIGMVSTKVLEKIELLR